MSNIHAVVIGLIKSEMDQKFIKGYVQMKGMDDFILVPNIKDAFIFIDSKDAQKFIDIERLRAGDKWTDRVKCLAIKSVLLQKK